jgi:hypothetical protein
VSLPTEAGLVVYVGQTLDLEVRCVDSRGKPVDLTGYEVLFTARQNASLPIITKSSAVDGEIDVEPLLGKVTVHLKAADTEVSAAQYVYDLWAVKASPLQRLVLIPPSDFVVEVAATSF